MPRFVKRNIFFYSYIQTLKLKIGAIKGKEDYRLVSKYASLKELEEAYKAFKEREVNAEHRCSALKNEIEGIDKKLVGYKKKEIDLGEKRRSAEMDYSTLKNDGLYKISLQTLTQQYEKMQAEVKVIFDDMAELNKIYNKAGRVTDLDASEVLAVKRVVDTFFDQYTLTQFEQSLNLDNGRISMPKKVSKDEGCHFIRVIRFATDFIVIDLKQAKKSVYYLQNYFVLMNLRSNFMGRDISTQRGVTLACDYFFYSIYLRAKEPVKYLNAGLSQINIGIKKLYHLAWATNVLINLIPGVLCSFPFFTSYKYPGRSIHQSIFLGLNVLATISSLYFYVNSNFIRLTKPISLFAMLTTGFLISLLPLVPTNQCIDSDVDWFYPLLLAEGVVFSVIDYFRAGLCDSLAKNFNAFYNSKEYFQQTELLSRTEMKSIKRVENFVNRRQQKIDTSKNTLVSTRMSSP
jgi:hypothetical protein